nr:CRE-CED-11 protein [Haemonchus contortus]
MDDSETSVTDLSVSPESVAIAVGGGGVGGMQICPSIMLGSTQYLSRFQSALNVLIGGGSLWLISSGEHHDPLARTVSSALRTVLPQTECDVEVLHVMVNTASVTAREEGRLMVDSSLNTLLLLSRNIEPGEEAVFRANAVVRLAHPPPALLIGVPSENITSGTTPSGAAPPILLSPSNDKRPLPAVVFAGASLMSLGELLVYVENGIPVVVLQDSCELCVVLHSAYLLYRSSQFEHSKFVVWLEEQLDAVSIGDVAMATNTVVRIFAMAFGDTQLIEFLDSDELPTLPSRIIESCLQCHSGSTEARQLLQLAAHINEPSILNEIDLEELLDDEVMSTILCETVAVSDRVTFLAAILERKPQISITSEMLLKMARSSSDQHFFTTVILCQCMGYSSFPEELDEKFVHDLNRLLKRLSFGVEDLIPPSTLNGDFMQHRDPADSIRILAIWALLLHCPSVVRCLCAFSDQPVAFSLVLSRLAKSLARESHDWFFYEESLLRLADSLSNSAVALVSKVHKVSPNKAYRLLCQPLEGFHGATLSQLAFQFNNRALIAHESCQRWLHRLLYGQLQTCSSTILPRWLKTLLAAVFVVPIRWWMCVRTNGVSAQFSGADRKSPTASLLDVDRQPKRVRAISTYSVISARSDILSGGHSMPQLAFTESVTPQSMVFPLNIEDVEGEDMVFTKKPRPISRRAPPSLCVFYSTPIVKYWLSLLFRLLHIALLAYSILLPGCGNLTLDAVVWMWTFIAWIEAVWVLNMRNHTTPLSLMPWRVFDCVLTLSFLVSMLLFKFVGDSAVSDFFLLSTVYPVRVLSSLFLLYWCYATIFFYIPLSELFGPIIVRVKLMILRDFTNFLILVALVMSSSAAAIHAVLYPDRDISLSVARSSLSWVWLSLFTTDLSSLKESDSCKKAFLGPSTSYCNYVGEYGNTSCPSQSTAGYLVVLEYFVLLKLILWPILFAFFAKTAKSVDDEADKIWKYQMYSLVTEFSLRPPLPPPLTPLFFFCMACCRAGGQLGGMMSSYPDHPDVDHRDRVRSTVRFGSVYRNPSVPAKKNEFVNSFWRQLMIDRWREETQVKSDDIGHADTKIIQKQLRMLALNNAYLGGERRSKSEMELVPYAGTEIRRLSVPAQERSWQVLLPRYSPPFYCRPAEEFPTDIAKHVEVATEQNVSELRRLWRSRQAMDSGKGWMLSAAGYPLNPHGRRGIAGRGCHPRFGANKRCYYIILTGTTRAHCKVLLDTQNNLPNEPHPESSSKDEHLASLLRTIGLPESDAQVFSMRRLDSSIIDSSETVPPTDTSPAHIARLAIEHDIDTDHAWTEHDLWAISLRDRKVLDSAIGYNWHSIDSAILLSSVHTDLLNKTLRVYGIE